MPITADAVVIGGGIVGTSTAFHLALGGAKRVVLCERRGLAAGASGRSAAFIQMHMRTVPEARLCAASMPYWSSWQELVGAGDDVFVRTGYLRMEPLANASKLRANVEMLRQAGINTQLIPPDEVSHLVPFVTTDDIAGGAYEPDGGYANAVNATLGFAQRAQQLGAEIIVGAEVTGIVRARERVNGVEATCGRIVTPIVVVAAGAWSAPLLSRLGVRLPVERARVQVAWFHWSLEMHPATLFAIMDGARRVYYRSDAADSARVVVGLDTGGALPLSDPDSSQEEVDADYANACLGRLTRSASRATDVHFIGGRAGPVNITPDRAPIIDQCAQVRGLFYVLDSGRNFKTAPAIGRAVGEWALHGASRVVDLRPFRASRFAERDLLIGANDYENPTEHFEHVRAARGASTSRNSGSHFSGSTFTESHG